MDTNIKIKCCKKRSAKDIIGFCDTCNEFFCRKCIVDHIEHKIMKIENYCEKNKVSVCEYIAQLEEEGRKRLLK